MALIAVGADGCAVRWSQPFHVYVRPVNAPPAEVKQLIATLRRMGFHAVTEIHVPTGHIKHTVVIYGSDEPTRRRAERIRRLLIKDYGYKHVLLKARAWSNHNYTSHNIGILLLH